MPKPYNRRVGVYHYGQHNFTVSFKHKWQAYLFHLLLNASLNHAGTRDY